MSNTSHEQTEKRGGLGAKTKLLLFILGGLAIVLVLWVIVVLSFVVLRLSADVGGDDMRPITERSHILSAPRNTQVRFELSDFDPECSLSSSGMLIKGSVKYHLIEGQLDDSLHTFVLEAFMTDGHKALSFEEERSARVFLPDGEIDFECRYSEPRFKEGREIFYEVILKHRETIDVGRWQNTTASDLLKGKFLLEYP